MGPVESGYDEERTHGEEEARTRGEEKASGKHSRTGRGALSEGVTRSIHASERYTPFKNIERNRT